MDIRRKLCYILAAVFMVVMTGSTGYYIIYGGEPKFMDCLYMTVITLTGVGYGEVVEVTGNTAAQLFTMFIIAFGMGIILYGIGTLTAMIIEGELTGILKREKMLKRIQKLVNHYLVCGGGETGRPLVDELIKNHEDVVLIEQNEEKIKLGLASGMDRMLYIIGDATEDQTLLAAGIEKAAGILVCLPSDRDNLFVTMTARMLNPKIRIISRISLPSLEPKLRKAGADRVVSPNMIGALRMASEMIRPTAVDFLDTMLRSKQGTLRIHQITLSPASKLIGKKIMESGLKDKYGLLILGSKEKGCALLFNPPPDTILAPGLSLIVMGDVDRIAQVKKIC